MHAPTSVLSDGTIRRLVDAGRVVIDPWEPGMVQPASVDLRLGDSFRVFHNHRAAAIDLREPPTNLTEEVVVGCVEHGQHLARADDAPHRGIPRTCTLIFGPGHPEGGLGVALVTAANNVPISSAPSLYAAVISVAAHEIRDPTFVYCNPEPPVEFGAWGIDVPVAWKGGTQLTATGNSFAAPHISGLVARILAKHPGLTVFHLKAILRSVAANLARRPRSG